MGILEAAIFGGLLIGTVSCSYLLKATNSTTVFGVSAGFQFLGLLFVIFLIDESIPPYPNAPTTLFGKLKELFAFSLVTDMMTACIKVRPYFDRAIIWMTMLVLGLQIFVMEGSANVYFLFVREKFHWTIKEYTLMEASSISIQIIGTLFAMFVLIKYLRLPEIILALLAMSSQIIDGTIMALAVYSWHIYLAISVTFLKSCSTPMCRAVISKVVTGDDAGKVYSLTSSIETFLPIFSAFLYTYVYNNTLTVYPGAFNLLNVGFYLICLMIMFVVMAFLKKRTSNTIGIEYESLIQ